MNLYEDVFIFIVDNIIIEFNPSRENYIFNKINEMNFFSKDKKIGNYFL